MKKKILAIIVAVLMMATLFAACNSSENSGELKPIAKEDMKIGFLYIGDIGDMGYSFAHDQGRLALEEAGYETVYVENVPESSDCASRIRDLIENDGCNVIYATSYGHWPYVVEVAKEYPDVYFGHATAGSEILAENLPNVTTYMGAVYESRYLAGIAAGLETKTNKIGYVAAMALPEVVRGCNAFTLGVRSVNPEATVEVIYINSWYDPTAESAAATTLMDNGCDIMAQHCDSTAPQTAAADRGLKSIGYNSPTASFNPTSYMTAPLFHWDVFYLNDVNSIVDGTWAPRNYWEGLDAGMVDLDECINMADSTKAAIEEARAKIVDGSLYIFSGEIKDNKGEVKVAAGEKMAAEDIWGMMWNVEGVIAG